MVARTFNDVLEASRFVAAQQHVAENLDVAVPQFEFRVATQSPVENRLKILVLKDVNRGLVFLPFDNSKFVEKGQFSDWRRSTIIHALSCVRNENKL